MHNNNKKKSNQEFETSQSTRHDNKAFVLKKTKYYLQHQVVDSAELTMNFLESTIALSEIHRAFEPASVSQNQQNRRHANKKQLLFF